MVGRSCSTEGGSRGHDTSLLMMRVDATRFPCTLTKYRNTITMKAAKSTIFRQGVYDPVSQTAFSSCSEIKEGIGKDYVSMETSTRISGRTRRGVLLSTDHVRVSGSSELQSLLHRN
jgi:hypothetical protein